MVRGAREYKMQNFQTKPEISPKNHKVSIRDPEGSIEGPWLVLDPMEVRSCVPRVPRNVLSGLICIHIIDTVDFRGDDDCASPPPVIIDLKNLRQPLVFENRNVDISKERDQSKSASGV